MNPAIPSNISILELFDGTVGFIAQYLILILNLIK